MLGIAHTHQHLGSLLADLARAVTSAADGTERADTEALEQIAECASLLRDDLVEHFAREEEGFFPILSERLRSLTPEIDALVATHAALIALLDAIERSTRAPGADILALFKQFEAMYAEHSRHEGVVFDRADRELSDDDKRAAKAALEGL